MYQTLETVFHRLFKHLEFCPKYFPARRTLSRVCDILLITLIGNVVPFMSMIERKYCLISTSCLAGLSDIVCILMSFHQRGHLVMVIIRNLNLISVQSWTYLCRSGQ